MYSKSVLLFWLAENQSRSGRYNKKLSCLCLRTMTRLDARNQKNLTVRNRSNQFKLDPNEQWMNRMHKLRRNFKIRSMSSKSSATLAATLSVVPSVNKMWLIYMNCILKYKTFQTSQKYFAWMIYIHMCSARSKIIIVTRTK